MEADGFKDDFEGYAFLGGEGEAVIVEDGEGLSKGGCTKEEVSSTGKGIPLTRIF